MSYFIIFVLCVILLFTYIYRYNHHMYKELLIGTIVGRYKGDLYTGGYMVVEFDVKDPTTLLPMKIQQTYKVPEEYYKQKQIGDKGMFPVNDNH